MSPGDPTDNALAAIASMLDQPEPHREPETGAVAEKPIAREPIEADGYSKTGPGPMAAIDRRKLDTPCQRTAVQGCRDRLG